MGLQTVHGFIIQSYGTLFYSNHDHTGSIRPLLYTCHESADVLTCEIFTCSGLFYSCNSKGNFLKFGGMNSKPLRVKRSTDGVNEVPR